MIQYGDRCWRTALSSDIRTTLILEDVQEDFYNECIETISLVRSQPKDFIPYLWVTVDGRNEKFWPTKAMSVNGKKSIEGSILLS